MQFNKNKTVFIHQWYPFVEGYSKEFIESILDEINYQPTQVLEPFSGSGTTALELQLKNINCVSFEVSPFMHLLSSVKLRKDYKSDDLSTILKTFKVNIKKAPLDIRNYQNIPFGKTVVKNEKLKKWNFNDESLDGILDIKYSIAKIKDSKYSDLFRIVLASILLEVSNLFRNGKCLSYKNKWETKINFTRQDIHNIFMSRIENTIVADIQRLENLSENIIVDNYSNLHFGDVRENILNLADDSVDLIITSPPYLNSRDYTDIYMLELKVLNLINSHEELINLRKSTVRSHVQVKHGDLEILNIPLLAAYIEKVQNNSTEFWNSDLLNMIKGYFLDMDLLFDQFKRVLQKDKFIYFNVANSAYFGEEIKVDEIICDIAVSKGFNIVEIRKARDLKASSQQSGNIKSLRESVIVIKS